MHSFFVINNTILALAEKGIYLGKKHIKLAETESGTQFVIKKSVYEHDVLEHEGNIIQRLNIGWESIERNDKLYIVYPYLGITLRDYLTLRSNLSLDELYKLAIKISLKLDDLHRVQKICHNDIHYLNVLVNEDQEVHFIDFEVADNMNQEDLTGDLESLISLFSPCINNLMLLEINKPYFFGIEQAQQNETLYELIKDPEDYIDKFKTSALDIAKILTLCRFNLEIGKDLLSALTDPQLFVLITFLNKHYRTIFTILESLKDQSLNLQNQFKRDFLLYCKESVQESKPKVNPMLSLKTLAFKVLLPNSIFAQKNPDTPQNIKTAHSFF